MTDTRLNREAVIVPVGDIDPQARLNREAVYAAHTLPPSAITTIVNRMCVYVAISRPHGWDIFDDPPL